MTLSNGLKKVKRLERSWERTPEILLCPNIPKPMHGVAPRVILGQKWWNATRKKAYASTSYHCLACGVHKTDARGPKWLEGHELYDVDYARGRLTYLRTVPLCNYCHNYVHDGRMVALVEKSEMRKSKYVSVVQHGDAVLSAARLSRPSRQDRENAIIDLLLNNELAAWGDWRLVLDGKEYKPKFKSEEQWRLAFK